MKDEKIGAMAIPLIPKELMGEERKKWLLTNVFPGISKESSLTYLKNKSGKYDCFATYFAKEVASKNPFLISLLLDYIKYYEVVYKLYGDPNDTIANLRELVLKAEDSYIHLIGSLTTDKYQIKEYISKGIYKETTLMVDAQTICAMTYFLFEEPEGIVVQEIFEKYEGDQLVHQKRESQVYSKAMISQSCDEYNAENYGEISYPGLNYEGLINRTIKLQYTGADTKVTPEVVNKVIFTKKNKGGKVTISVIINDKNVSNEYQDIESIEQAYSKYISENASRIKAQERAALNPINSDLFEEAEISPENITDGIENPCLKCQTKGTCDMLEITADSCLSLKKYQKNK